jgi:hypothetical protein
MAKNTQAKALSKAARSLMAEERSLLLLPVLGSVLALFSSVVVGTPAVLLLAAFHFNFHLRQGNVVEAILFFPVLIVSTFFVILCNSAVAIAAGERLRNGTHLHVSDALAQAWAKRGTIFKWSVFAAVVGTILEQLRRFGLAGKIVEAIGGVAWAVAVFFIVPVLVFENLTPLAAAKRSSSLLVGRFGQVTRSQLRISLRIVGLALLAMFVFFVGMVIVITSLGSTPRNLSLTFVGGGVAVASVLAFFYLVIWSSTIATYLRTILYFYASGQEMPNLGVDLSQVFAK